MIEKPITDVTDIIKNRLGSPMYWTFILSWFLINRQIRYVSFFISWEEITKKWFTTKIDYIISLYSLGTAREVLYTIWHLILFPSIMVFVFIWILHKLDLLVYKKNIINKNQKQILKNKEQIKSLNIVEEKLEAVSNVKKAEKKLEKTKTKEDIWQEEYNVLIANNSFKKAMEDLKISLYSNSWRMFVNGKKTISTDSLWFLDGNSLVSIDFEDNIIHKTDKWDFFIKNYINWWDYRSDLPF